MSDRQLFVIMALSSDKKFSRVQHAKTFMEEMEPFFTKIRNPRASPSLSTCGKETIRIAILDSGVDDMDPVIRGAIRSGRIIRRRSWVGNIDDHQDTYGHGTHVTRLLLKSGPAAEICIAKICKGKVISAEFMHGIAKVGSPYM